MTTSIPDQDKSFGKFFGKMTENTKLTYVIESKYTTFKHGGAIPVGAIPVIIVSRNRSKLFLHLPTNENH